MRFATTAESHRGQHAADVVTLTVNKEMAHDPELRRDAVVQAVLAQLTTSAMGTAEAHAFSGTGTRHASGARPTSGRRSGERSRTDSASRSGTSSRTQTRRRLALASRSRSCASPAAAHDAQPMSTPPPDAIAAPLHGAPQRRRRQGHARATTLEFWWVARCPHRLPPTWSGVPKGRWSARCASPGRSRRSAARRSSRASTRCATGSSRRTAIISARRRSASSCS